MQIKSLTLKNFRGFKDAEITFSEGLTVLVGVNGAGKSSVLDALAMMFSWAVARIKGEKSGPPIDRTDVKNGENDAFLRTKVGYSGEEYDWTLAGWIPGRERVFRSHWAELNKLAENIQQRISTALLLHSSTPVIAYYPTRRSVKKVKVDIAKQWVKLDHIESYELPLGSTVDFASFFEWFRYREDLRNEMWIKAREEAESANRDLKLAETLLSIDPHLAAVRHAIQSLLPGISNLGVQRQERAIVATKDGTAFRIDQLSDGEKCLIAMTGDIARKLSLANPSSQTPLHGEGVVLIDEIEQHLHPKWQREMIGNLRRTFPNVQFIVSTHSPQVLGAVNHEDIRCLYLDPERGQQVYVPERSLGLDSNSILEEVFAAGRRNAGVAEKLEKIFELIALESFDAAQEHIAELETELGSDIPDLIKAKTMIAMLEGSGAEHS